MLITCCGPSSENSGVDRASFLPPRSCPALRVGSFSISWVWPWHYPPHIHTDTHTHTTHTVLEAGVSPLQPAVPCSRPHSRCFHPGGVTLPCRVIPSILWFWRSLLLRYLILCGHDVLALDPAEEMLFTVLCGSARHLLLNRCRWRESSCIKYL